jgi:clan AA aspartic protease (TIGR02281 family)
MAFLGHTLKMSKPNQAVRWLYLIIFTLLWLWPSLATTAMYRCQDPSGTTVLTDNPAQLNDCSRIESYMQSAQNQPQIMPQPSQNIVPATTQRSQNQAIPSEPSSSQEPNHAPQSYTDIIIPLKKIGGSFVVQAHLNNERMAYLIVDTGASMTVLSTNIAIDLGILGTTDNELMTVNTAGGSVQVNMNYLATLNVGEAQAHHVAVAIHDLPDIPEQIEGLLGMSFLKNFLITLDAEHNKLTLRPKPTS